MNTIKLLAGGAFLVAVSALTVQKVNADTVFTYDFKTLDNSMHGEKWAIDNFHSTVTFVPTEGNCYTYTRNDGGTFETLGTKSPGGDGVTTVDAGVKGTVSGILEGQICGDFKEDITNESPEDLTIGSYPSYEEKYFHHFFDNISGFTISNWGWTFASCGNGTWVDNEETEAAWQSEKPNALMGDITGSPAACQNPTPTAAPSSNNSNSGSSVKGVEMPSAPQCTDSKPSQGVANVKVTRTSPTTALVEWSLHSGDQTHVIFGETGTGWKHAALNVGISGHTTINFLVKGRTYDWQVIPMNGCASGERSKIVTNI